MSHESAFSKTENEVVSIRSQEPSDISCRQASNPAGRSEQSTVRTADPLSVQFSTFVATIATLLNTFCSDKLEQSKQLCSNLTISDNLDKLLFSDTQLQEINACSTFSELFAILRNHWSYSNYSILRQIIVTTNLKEAKDELQLFKTRMASYEGMKILSENSPPEAIFREYVKLQIIIESSYQELTLEDFTRLHDFVFKHLDIKYYTALPHIKFLFGSLHLEWYVLKKAAAHMIKMAKQNEEVFTSNSVVFIQVDQSVIFDFTTKNDDQMDDHNSNFNSNYKGRRFDNTFVDSPPERLMCKICLSPCREAQQSECCGHIYCKDDIDQLKATTALQSITCPVCCAEDFVTYPNLEIDREIQQLMVYCPDKEAGGCDWVGNLKDVDKHYSYGRECETECEKCNTTVKHKLLRSHLDTECPCYCPYCDITAEREVISSEHKEKCHKFPLTCPNNCGQDNIPRDDMDEHKKVCPLEVIQCEFHDIGCEAKIPREDEDNHAKDNVTTHLQLAQRHLTILNKMLEDSNTNNLETTEKFTELLTDLQERLKIFENTYHPLSKEQSTQSVDVKVQTDMSGNDIDVVTNALRQYCLISKNCIILMLFTLVISLAISMFTLHADYNTTPNYNLPTIEEFHEKLSVFFYETVDQSKEPWSKKLNYWSNLATTVVPVVLKFSEFSSSKQKRFLQSKPFFAFTNGYLMCLRIYPTELPGLGIKDNFLSFTLHLMKGPYDDALERLSYFPMNKSFTVELLDPAGKSHIQKEVSPDSEGCNSEVWVNRVTNGDMNVKGCGYPKLVSLEGYDFKQSCPCNEANQTICCYLTHDDALYFRLQAAKPLKHN